MQPGFIKDQYTGYQIAMDHDTLEHWFSAKEGKDPQNLWKILKDFFFPVQLCNSTKIKVDGMYG